MSLTEVSLLSISFKQYFYKLKANTHLINRLILAQIMVLLFSLGGGSYMSSGNGQLSVSVRIYSANMVIIFSIIWITIVAVLLTTKAYKHMEAPLVANRLTGNLSDIGFLMTASVFAGITASLGGIILRILMYFTMGRSTLVLNEFFLTFSDLLLSMVVTILYMGLVSALGYFIGVLAQVNMVSAILIPAMIFGSQRVYSDMPQSFFKFYVSDVSLPSFALKVIITALILFGTSLLISNRMEVNP